MIYWYCPTCSRIISYDVVPSPKHEHSVFGLNVTELLQYVQQDGKTTQ